MTDRLISVVDDDHQFVPLPPGTFKPGVIFSMRRILRFAIVLLGLQLSFAQLVKVSTVGLAIIAVTLAATFVFTMRLGRWLGIDRTLTQLIASGTSLCGASAAIATNTVTRSDEDVTYAVRRNPETARTRRSPALLTWDPQPPILNQIFTRFHSFSHADVGQRCQIVARAEVLASRDVFMAAIDFSGLVDAENGPMSRPPPTKGFADLSEARGRPRQACALGKSSCLFGVTHMQKKLINGAARPDALRVLDKARIAKTWQQYYEDRGYKLWGFSPSPAARILAQAILDSNPRR